jgi:2-polyprenyl-3-methyl-5-hydroxy-6-metoxy-1,4-benzoquinol methylase
MMSPPKVDLAMRGELSPDCIGPVLAKREMAGGSFEMHREDIRVQAQEILHSLESDVGLVPPALADWWVAYLRGSSQRYLDSLSFLESSDATGRILEIGSVPGHLTVLLTRLGYDVHGVDIDPTRVERLWDEYGISVDTVDVEQESLPYAPDSYDVVLFLETIEHLRIDPLHALREAQRVLKRRGRIILSTDNITPIHRLLFFLGRSYQGSLVEEFKKLETLGHMGHIRKYSFQELRELLEYVGFDACRRAYGGGLSLVWGARIGRLLYPKKEHFCRSLYVIAEAE